MSLVKRCQGIALIQVLLITAILSIFAMYLTVTAKEQVMIAQWSDDLAQAKVNIHDAESSVVYALLTESLINQSLTTNAESDAGNEPLLSKWNMFGIAFNYSSTVSIKLQDQAGLINAHYPKHDVLKTFIRSQGYSEELANKLLDSLLDWQDLDTTARSNGSEISSKNRNGAISNLHELEFIPNIPEELLPVLIKNLTLHRRNNFNPMNSSIELISALSNQQAALQVHTLRLNKQLNKNNFSELTGITEDDGYYFYPSNYFSINLKSTVNDSIATKEVILKVAPTVTNITPINIYLSRS